MNKNIKQVRLDGFDKFYTNPEIAKKCIDKVIELYGNDWNLIIEPSAGNGNFLSQIPNDNKIGIDIHPEHEDIITMDFFDFNYEQLSKQKSQEIDESILVIGNPPFGKVSSMAIKFFNHAAKWTNVIAFIIPRTFRKPSVQNKLNDNFHLIYDEELPTNPCCFKPQMMVKCCFQIWEKKTTKRELVKLETKHKHWDFLSFGPKDNKGQPTPPKDADFVIKAYGGKCGEIKTNNLENLRPKSWHWIKCKIDKEELIKRFKQLDYSISLNTARQNSLGRGELVNLYTEFVNSII